MTCTMTVLTAADIRPVARLHQAAFPGFFLSTLGEPFLALFYGGFLADSSAVTVVARGADGSLLGVAVGTTEPAGFFGRLVRSRWPSFVLAGARAVVRNPGVTARLLRAVRFRGGVPAGFRGALLSSICVDPAMRGNGVGRQLVQAWTQEVARRGVDAALLTTDAEDNDVANRFYRSLGWVLSGGHVTPEGRAMNCYIKTWGTPRC
jgi:ribosomal protein S18 acetylase RimI-like enzyme